MNGPVFKITCAGEALALLICVAVLRFNRRHNKAFLCCAAFWRASPMIGPAVHISMMGNLINIMMAMPVTLSASGVNWSLPEGTQDDINALRESYAHLTALRDQTIDDGILPPLSEWGGSNIHLG